MSLEFPIPPGESPILDALPTPPPTSPISDAVDAPPLVMDKATQAGVARRQEPKFLSAVFPSSTNNSTGNRAGPAAVSIHLPVSGMEPALESPIVQPEELHLVNGLTAYANRDISPLAEPDITKEAPPIIEKCSTRTTKSVPPVVKGTPTQVLSETLPLLTVKESCVLSIQETPDPKPTPTPVVAVISTPVVTETLSVFVRDNPSSAIKEITAPVAKETLIPVFLETPSFATETSKPVVKETVEEPCPISKETSSPLEPVCVAAQAMPLPAPTEEREDTSPPQTALESTMQGTCKEKILRKFAIVCGGNLVVDPSFLHVAVSVPKKKRKLKDLNKKETGDVLDAFKEVCVHVF